MIAGVITDIEGTTSSIAFVKDLLFPHARAVLRRFLARRGDEPEVRALIAEVERLEPGDPAATLERWMDADQKIGPLKALQGLIWDEGYASGLLRGHVYDDVAPALRRWVAQGLRLAVFSSGSVRAQHGLFGHSLAGDLQPLFSGWFDTQAGAKNDPRSYAKIAAAMDLPPEQLLFLSDITAELDAARAAGMQTTQLLRDGQTAGNHACARTFDEVAIPENPARERARLDSIKLAVASMARACHARGWAQATSGNFSARVDSRSFAITTSGLDKGRIEASEIMLVGTDGAPLEEGRPSAETPLHAALYRRFPAIGAVVHTHSVASTVLSRTHSGPALVLSGYEMQKALPGVSTHEGSLRIPVLANSQDVAELALRVDKVLGPETPAYLVAGHGMTTWAADCEAALRVAEGLEFLLACELASN